MAAVTVLPPYPHFKELDGTPLNNGYVYIGDAGVDPEANPATVYWDDALGTTATQPIRTINGYYSNAGTPADVFVNATNFSITVRDSAGALIFTKLNYDLALPFTTFDFQPQATGAVSRDITSKLSELVSVKDFGAVGDAVTSDNAAFTLAEALTQNYIYLPAGTYVVTGLSLTKTYWGPGQIELDSVLQDRFFDETTTAIKEANTFYADSGAADAYVLTSGNSRRVKTAYDDGMVVRFVADNASSGAACTVNVDGLGSRSIVAADAGAPAAGDISTSGINQMFYDLSNTRFELMHAESDIEAMLFPASSTAQNGYLEFQISPTVVWAFQWGQNATSSGGSTHSFPVAFTTARGIVASCDSSATAIRAQINSATQFALYVGSGTPNAFWYAWGII